MMKAALLLFVTSSLLAGVGPAKQLSDDSRQQRDYRSSTIYFLMADRFNPHQPNPPYSDPQYTSATNCINSYQDDYDPANGMRYYKHYQDDPRCQAAAQIADYDWSYWQLHHCLLADLSGYNQRDAAVADYLIGAGKTWIDHGVDDYRLDAVKFPFPEFIARFTHTMRGYLASLNRPTPYIVGEWSHGGVGDAKSLRFANRYNVFKTNILDFQLSFALNQFIGGDYEDVTQKLNAFDLDNFLHESMQAFRA